MYVLKQTGTPFNPLPKNAEIHEFGFSSTKLFQSDELTQSSFEQMLKILQLTYDYPMVIHESKEFVNLRQNHNGALLVVYCDPKKHGF